MTTKNRKTKALLAGGLVLGIGAAATLATWTAIEFANSSFTAGAFVLEGSVDGAKTFAPHPTSPGAGLRFGVTADKLSPNDVVYANYAIRLAKQSTAPGDVTIKAAGTTGTVSALSYTIVKSDTCDAASIAAAAPADILVPAGTPVGKVAGPASFTLPQKAEGAVDAVPVKLCIAVAADATLAQGQTGNAVWSFNAVSK